ncbi:glyoxalase [Rhizobium sp. Leaf384]|uniref:VOC family protein n=1 Tax=unclassified Rhizobium TaxID=2613769 RepID=UPI000715C389|nr:MULTISPECIES: VOC family protein [unclassified Rhizobium]KQS77037.1 glyoxalase [Rhizobium sp. Leaf384]KQS78308.1 glyoxalase [Rhizobium sp. Leaf383]
MTANPRDFDRVAPNGTSGLHHVTLITRKVQANVDFYVGFLGLRLVKRTAGFEDAAQLHLFYGDRTGTPGSLVSFLVWEDGGPGRVGEGQPSEIAFAIAPGSIGFWLQRALRYLVPVSGPAPEFGEPVLRLKDPDGVIVKLVGTTAVPGRNPAATDGIPPEDAIRALRGATILTSRAAETSSFLQRHTGFRSSEKSETIERLRSDAGDVIDVRDASGFWTSAPGTGTIDHIAVRAPSRAAVEALRERLGEENAGPTPAHDRTYFFSLYVREPGGSLIEVATDSPGMTIDEDEATLGTRLFVPGHFRDIAGETATLEDMTVLLPQFGLPGEERFAARDLPFIHRLHQADAADGSTLFLLHGSGANELSLLPLARRAAPHALLVALRGRSLEEGAPRFYRRLGAATFDQADIASEAEALAAFVEGAASGYGIDLERAAFLGYSNGANLIAASLFLQPGLIRRAILLRSMMPLDTVPEADLSGTEVLVVSGADDSFDAYRPAQVKALTEAGAETTVVTLAAGHELSPEDASTVARWLDARPARS